MADIWVLVSCMAIAAYKDHRTGNLPLLIFPIMMIGHTALMLIDGTFSFISALVGAAAGGLTFLCAALFFRGGGGDVIMMAALGWCVGPYTLCYIVIVSSLTYLLQLITTAARRHISIKEIQEPYAPSAFAGTLIVFLLFRI